MPDVGNVLETKGETDPCVTQFVTGRGKAKLRKFNLQNRRSLEHVLIDCRTLGSRRDEKKGWRWKQSSVLRIKK